MTIRHDGVSAEWLGYLGLQVETGDGTVVYLDPGRYGTLIGEWRTNSLNPNHPNRAITDRRMAA